MYSETTPTAYVRSFFARFLATVPHSTLLSIRGPLEPALEAIQVTVWKQPLVLEPPNDDAGGDALLLSEP